MAHKPLKAELALALKNILKECKNEDSSAYKEKVRHWQKLEAYWHGLQYIFWNAQTSQWVDGRNGNIGVDFESSDVADMPLYDYVINIYRAHGEAIIASLSSQIPGLRFLPDDADSADDVTTARTFGKLSDLISNHNNAALIFLKGIFYLWNCGLVASYKYKDADPKYGVTEIPVYGTKTVTSFKCEYCGYETDVTQDCPDCGVELVPEENEVPLQTGTKALPKTRVKIIVIGATSFKVPLHATDQESCDYLLWAKDAPKSTIQASLIPDFKDSELARKIAGESLSSTDRLPRNATTYPNTYEEQQGLTTLTQAWFRPETYWKVKDEASRLELLKMFPKGVHCTFVGKQDTLVDNEVTSPSAESMDERWDIGKAGLSTFIHADPLGNPLVSIQDMQNQLANLSIQTVDQGNPTMFADPETLNFGQVDTFQSVPGAIHRAKPAAGRTLAESFYTTQKVTLGKEVPVLKQQLDQTGQFVIGSFPSIYGGPSEGKSRTLGEYSQSRAMALQRLQIVWKFIVDWWKSTMTGAVRMYVDTVVEDQRFVTQKEGGYVNTWIRTSELKGKIGSVESDADEKFPVSAAQISAMLMKMIELNNPNINAGLYIPENLEMLRDAFGMSTFTIPGADQRLKQLRELENLSKGIPVTIDTLIDDDAVHIEIVKNFCISPSGMEMKDAQPEIYQTILQHLQMHNANMAAKTMQMQNNSMPGQQVPTAQGPAK